MEIKKFTFIHIPKTAGTTVLNSLRCSGIDVNYFLHSKLQSIDNRGITSPTISCVRNPFDRVYSFYHYFSNGENPIPTLKNITFDDFLDNLENIHPLIKPCYDFLTINDEYKCDYLLKFETLGEDYKNIMDRLGILLPCDLPHFRQNQFKPEIDKKNVYNLRQIEKINRIFEKDLSFFGYSYDNWLT